VVTRRLSEARVRSLARKKGFGGLVESGKQRMLEGLTTAEEILRVTFAEEVFDADDTQDAEKEG
jgi:type II secretory ATPase GspE/PulE/Tfp pilus assembly ATPase PilB-like protein